MRSTRILSLIIFALGLAANPGNSQAAQLSEGFAPCQGKYNLARGDWECGKVTVPIDRSSQVTGEIELAAIRYHKPGPPRPTVLAISGGPGESAIKSAETFRAAMRPLLDTHDMLVFDQRGTGWSGFLDCESLQGPTTYQKLSGCAEELGPKRAFYSTLDTVKDIEEIRSLLDIPSLSVYGVSYGTKTALEYARYHPSRVRLLVLNSPFDPDYMDPFFRDTYPAMGKLLNKICTICRFTKSPASDLAKIAKQASKETLVAELPYPPDKLFKYGVDDRMLFFSLLKMASSGEYARRAPALINSAAQGDLAPLIRNLYYSGPVIQKGGTYDGNSSSTALYFATSCMDEQLPFNEQDNIEVRKGKVLSYLETIRASFFPFDAVTSLKTGNALRCVGFPEAGRAMPPAPELPKNIRTLILSGQTDLNTPPVLAERLKAKIPAATLVKIDGVGHDVIGWSEGCVDRVIRSFLNRKKVNDCKKPFSKTRYQPAGSPNIASLSQVPALEGYPDKIGKAIKAIELSFEELYQVVSPGVAQRQPFAGLRGGWGRTYGIWGSQMLLRKFSYIKGLELTGRFTSHPTRFGEEMSRARLTVSGEVKGKVRASPTTIKGEINGVGFELARKRYKFSSRSLKILKGKNPQVMIP